MATPASVATSRTINAFIGTLYQPFATDSAFTLDLLAASVPKDTKTDLTL
jgi:hypothetical protein